MTGGSGPVDRDQCSAPAAPLCVQRPRRGAALVALAAAAHKVASVAIPPASAADRGEGRGAIRVYPLKRPKRERNDV